jgi:hypothetical protein
MDGFWSQLRGGNVQEQQHARLEIAFLASPGGQKIGC